MGCCKSRIIATSEEWLKEGESHPRWRSVMNLGIHRNPDTLPILSREGGKTIRISELEGNVLGIGIPVVELLSEMNTMEGCIRFYLFKNSYSINEGIMEIDLVIIVDSLFVRYSVPINFMGVLIDEQNGKEERFATSFMMNENRAVKVSVNALTGSFVFNIKGFLVGSNDCEIQYDAEEEYNKKIADILDESVNKVIQNLRNPERGYPMMAKAYRKLVPLETFAKEILEGKLF